MPDLRPHAAIPEPHPWPKLAFAAMDCLANPRLWDKDPQEPDQHRETDDPSLEFVVECRFRRDPIDFRGGDQNLYRYVANRPTFGMDPTGYFLVAAIGGLSAEQQTQRQLGSQTSLKLVYQADGSLTSNPAGVSSYLPGSFVGGYYAFVLTFPPDCQKPVQFVRLARREIQSNGVTMSSGGHPWKVDKARWFDPSAPGGAQVMATGDSPGNPNGAHLPLGIFALWEFQDFYFIDKQLVASTSTSQTMGSLGLGQGAVAAISGSGEDGFSKPASLTPQFNALTIQQGVNTIPDTSAKWTEAYWASHTSPVAVPFGP